MINKPCVLIRRTDDGDEDELGNPIPDEDPVDTFCEVQMASSDEPLGEGEMSMDYWNVFLLIGDEARTGDSLIVPGYGQFEFMGNSWEARDGSRDMWHVEGRARRTLMPEEIGS